LQLAKTRPSPAVEHTRDAMSRGKMLLLEREKLIKVANRSEFSWEVVAKYMAYELAEDSNDEKRLEKAEKAAEQKAVKQKRKHTELCQPSCRSPGSLLVQLPLLHLPKQAPFNVPT